jgi:hypothetical protein
MNIKLILLLSLFVLAMDFATVFCILSKIESLFLQVIFIICAFLIAKTATGRYFLHGFIVSLVNRVLTTD